MRPEDVARNFEELIQSDQTIQYTLTPESMRDIDVRYSLEHFYLLVSATSYLRANVMVPVHAIHQRRQLDFQGSEER